MRVIVISRPDFFQGESEWINALFRAGLTTLHLRKPNTACEKMEALLCQIDAAYYKRIVLHDHLTLAAKFSLKGVHLNARNDSAPDDFHGSRSRSCHSLEEVARHKESFDYLTLSPIFDSISKQGYRSPFSLEGLRSASLEGLLDEKVIALGGITEQNITQVQALGFGGVALLGEVWQCSTKDEAAAKIARINSVANPAKVLSIAGSDPSGGAGIQADIKSITALGGYAATAITALTVQNTLGVKAIYPTSPQILTEQIIAVMEDIKPQVVKIGMVGDEPTARAIVQTLSEYPRTSIVYDPVIRSTSGHSLLSKQALTFIESALLPTVTLLTPNRDEAEVLWRNPINSLEDMGRAAKELSARYGIGVLLKGGHLQGEQMCDVLCEKGKQVYRFTSQRIATRNLHGTGCTLASAIATLMAQGLILRDACMEAKRYTAQAIEAGSSRLIGEGNGPLWHMVGRDF